MLTDLEGDHAEEMQGVGVAGLVLKNLAVNRFRLWQPSGLMVGDGDTDGFLDSDGVHRISITRPAAKAGFPCV